jgi:DNA uptake protein ComE-like DNA-binding protein
MKQSLRLILPLAVAIACAGNDATTDTAAATDSAAGATGPIATATDTSASTQTGAMVDPNAATPQQLVGAGVDSATAAAVVAGRPYSDMTAVDRVLSARNMTAEQRRAVYARVWKPIDLNTATDQEILLIPGIGNRMLHEFKEYRPYTSIGQFRREMGKYVDDTEVARLEKYVSIRS